MTATLILTLAIAAVAAWLVSASLSLAARPPHAGAPVRFTLVTGETVTVTPLADGSFATQLEFAPSAGALASNLDALAALPEYSRLDTAFFDAPYLMEQGFPLSDNWPVIVDLDNEANPHDFNRATAAQGVTFTEISRELNLWAARVPIHRSGLLTRQLLQRDDVRKIWLDAFAEAALDVSASQVGAPALWTAGLRGQGVTIAALDTGVNQAHPDFQDRVTLRTFFITCPSEPPCPDYHPEDEHGHGTHVAGIAAGDGPVYRGIAPGAALWSVKVLGKNGNGPVSNIIRGIAFAAKGPDGELNTGDEADVINLSLGAGTSGDGSDPLSQAADWAVAQGLVVVAAAGNSGSDTNGDAVKDRFTLRQPAVARQVITVGATHGSDNIAWFSSSGPTADLRLKPDVVAPGVNIFSASHVGSGHTSKSGTSMSTPHVAGAAALLRQKHPDWTPEQVRSALMGSATPLSGPRLWEQGAGRLRVDQAADTPLLATPPSLSFGHVVNDAGPVSQHFTLHNVSDRELTVSLTVSGVASGFPVDGVAVSPSNLVIAPGETAEATVTVNPATYVGWHEGRVLLNYGDWEINVPYLFRWQPQTPQLSISPGAFDIAVNRGVKLSRNVTIANLGPGNLQYNLGFDETASVDNPDAGQRYSASPLSGTITPGNSMTVNVTINTNGMPSGVNRANLMVRHNGRGERPVVVPITLTVQTAQVSGGAMLQQRAIHEGVTVKFIGPERRTVTTGADGAFALELNPGSYEVWASHPYHLPAFSVSAALPAGAYAWSVELLLGDWNGDEVVNLLDLRPVADNIGQAAGAAGSGDGDGDGWLDGLDLALTARNFSRVASPWQQGPP